MTHVTINTDGACLGNPGPGGFAAIIEWAPDGLITVSGGDPSTTPTAWSSRPSSRPSGSCRPSRR